MLTPIIYDSIYDRHLTFAIMEMKENIILDKSKAFALRIIRLYKYLCNEQHEYVLSKQLLRSGTSIGANVKYNAANSLRQKLDLI